MSGNIVPMSRSMSDRLRLKLCGAEISRAATRQPAELSGEGSAQGSRTGLLPQSYWPGPMQLLCHRPEVGRMQAFDINPARAPSAMLRHCMLSCSHSNHARLTTSIVFCDLVSTSSLVVAHPVHEHAPKGFVTLARAAGRHARAHR